MYRLNADCDVYNRSVPNVSALILLNIPKVSVANLRTSRLRPRRHRHEVCIQYCAYVYYLLCYYLLLFVLFTVLYSTSTVL
jgi:hypothetical protein